MLDDLWKVKKKKKKKTISDVWDKTGSPHWWSTWEKLISIKTPGPKMLQNHATH